MTPRDKQRLADDARSDDRATSSDRRLSDAELASVVGGAKYDIPSGGTGTGYPDGGKKP